MNIRDDKTFRSVCNLNIYDLYINFNIEMLKKKKMEIQLKRCYLKVEKLPVTVT